MRHHPQDTKSDPKELDLGPLERKKLKIKENAHASCPSEDDQTNETEGSNGRSEKKLSNWALLKLNLRNNKLKSGGAPRSNIKRLPYPRMSNADAGSSTIHTKLTRIVALDCEMVGAGKNGDRSLLARVTILNATGAVVYDTFVAPTEPVTDMRTKWSGVRAVNLKNAPSFEDVKKRVSRILRGRIVVGHALSNDLKALELEHPENDIRDTSQYVPLRRVLPSGRTKPQALKVLAEQHLQISIQVGEHDPVEDARAALSLYQKYSLEWETSLLKRGGGQDKKRKSSTVRATIQRNGTIHHPKKKARSFAEVDLIKLAENDVMADL